MSLKNKFNISNIDIKSGFVSIYHTTPQHNRFTALFRDYPGQPVPEEKIWTLWCKGRLTEARTHRPSGWAPLHPD